MVTSDLRDSGVVRDLIRLEHRSATANILRTRMLYGPAVSIEVEPQLQGQLAQQELIKIHQFKSDSVLQQVVEKSKVHTSDGYVVNVEKLQSMASVMKTVGNLQTVS